MHRTSPRPHSRSRAGLGACLALALIVAPLLVLSACGDTTAPAGGRQLPISVRFQAGAESARPITQIRVTAYMYVLDPCCEVPVPVEIGSNLVRVNPSAPEWRVSVDIPREIDSVVVRASVELLHQPASGAPVVEWSGMTDDVEVVGIETETVPEIALGRGPLSNLDVSFLALFLNQSTVMEGQTVSSTASTQEGALVFYGSLDTLVATVSPAGVVTTRRDGTARITATAGFVADTATLTVMSRPATVTISPDSLLLAQGQVGQFTAVVRDARGADLANTQTGGVIWRTSDPNVARGATLPGSFVGGAVGRAIVTAIAVADTTVRANAPVRVIPTFLATP